MNGYTEPTAIAGALIATVATCSLLLAAPRRPAIALVAFAAGWTTTLAAVAPQPVASQPVALAGALVTGAALALVLARMMHGRQHWIVVAAATVLPIRVPVPVGSETYNLLLPLYAVVGLALARLLLDARAQPAAPDASTDNATPPIPARPPKISGSGYARVLDATVCAMLAVTCASLTWAGDIEAGTVKVALFYLPFVLLYVAARRWLAGASVPTGRALVTVMSLAAIIGLYQRATHTIWQNPKVIVANTYTPDFRTNSIFWDPNIYGRYLVAAGLVLVVAVLLWKRPATGRRRGLLMIAAVAALLASGLWFTYSQSSFLALSIGAGALALVWMRRWERAIVVAMLVGVALHPATYDRVDRADDQGRLPVARAGVDLFRADPWLGVGVGSFESAYTHRLRERGEPLPRLRSSHTTPVTVLAELGIPGALAYLAMACAALLLVRRTAITISAGTRAGSGLPLWGAAMIAAIGAHSMFYAGFYEDPLTWVALAALATMPNEAADPAKAAPDRPTTT